MLKMIWTILLMAPWLHMAPWLYVHKASSVGEQLFNDELVTVIVFELALR